jgi:hypothetical protein
MATFSDFLELELLDHAFGVASWTAPATVYLALIHTAQSTDAAMGTEVTLGGYAREAITFGAAAAGAIANTAAVTFTASGAAYDGAIIGVAIMDAATAGNMLAWDDIISQAVADGDSIDFAIGDIDITLD